MKTTPEKKERNEKLYDCYKEFGAQETMKRFNVSKTRVYKIVRKYAIK